MLCAYENSIKHLNTFSKFVYFKDGFGPVVSSRKKEEEEESYKHGHNWKVSLKAKYIDWIGAFDHIADYSRAIAVDWFRTHNGLVGAIREFGSVQF